MSTVARVGTFLILAALSSIPAGCRSCPCGDDNIPPVPLKHCPDEGENGGMLLKTGSLQLGPGAGQDLLRSQAGGDWGL
jgi:hypothetical protein